MTMETLTRAGYAQYEISNYARLGAESRHNSAYWQGRDFLGFGPSAFSTVGLQRWQNVCDTASFVQRTLAGAETIGFSERLTSEMRAGEIAAFGMRTAQGVALADLARWPEAITQFRELGFLEQRGNRAVLTRRGKMMADTVAETFV
jgi:oxygen-independent coproporphyrinogen-3 oxidase